MTDKEIALELGAHLIRAKLRIAAMTGELDTYRESVWNPAPWRRHVDQILPETVLHLAQERVEDLTRALDAAKPEDLLRTLHSSLDELKY